MAKTAAKKKTQEKRSRSSMVKSLREYKKELQKARFRLSVKDQQKTANHRMLRKNIARTATLLTKVAKERKIADDSKKSAVSETAGNK